MSVTPKQLAQARPANTAAVSLYSPNAGEEIVGFLFISNNSGAEALARVFLDDDGTDYDETTQMAWDVRIRPQLPPLKIGPISMNDSDGNLAVRTSVGNALTFTFMGIVKTA